MKRIPHRAEAIMAQRRSGLTYVKIAENYSLSPPRVRQIVKRYEAGTLVSGIILDPERIEREWAKIDARRA